VKEDWQICPNCHTKLKKACQNCSKFMELPWNICPYCGTPAPGMRLESTSLDDALRGLKMGDEQTDVKVDSSQ